MRSSPDAGYIYILQNESLEPDRLKIGRTHHHPRLRAEELSQATGIPTPFTVAWYGRTEDCKKAERLVHQSLSPYRTNPKREFFDVELDEAIEAGKEAVKISGRKLNWFYQPQEQWNVDPNNPLSFGQFLFYQIFVPILKAPLKLIQLCFCIIWWIIAGILKFISGTISILLRIVKGVINHFAGKH